MNDFIGVDNQCDALSFRLAGGIGVRGIPPQAVPRYLGAMLAESQQACAECTSALCLRAPKRSIPQVFSL